MVAPAEVLELAVGPPAREVARARRGARRLRRRGRDEALRRQLGPAEIAARQAVAAEEELAGDADRHRLAPRASST